jgi:hypothetical protein
LSSLILEACIDRLLFLNLVYYWYTAKLLLLISSTIEKLVSFTSKVRLAVEKINHNMTS